MSKYARKSKKSRVAKRATVEQRLSFHPIPESLSALPDAKSVLHARHIELGSLADLSWELGGVNRGTLSSVEAGDREPSKKLIAKMNSVYGCHLHQKQVKITVDVCPNCGGIPKPRHRCPGAPQKYAPHPVTRWTVVERKAYLILSVLHAGTKNLE